MDDTTSCVEAGSYRFFVGTVLILRFVVQRVLYERAVEE